MAVPGARSAPPVARIVLAVGAALALADASVVTLALPALLTELRTTVEGVAAVIGVYTAVLAVAAPLAAALRPSVGDRMLAGVGLVAFAVASVACGAAGSLEVLLVARAAQGAGAAAALVGAFGLLRAGTAGRGEHDEGGRGTRADPLWVAAAIFGTAIGPALGGAVTDVFDWRAIFYAQAPIGALAAVAALVAGRRGAVGGLGGAAGGGHGASGVPGPRNAADARAGGSSDPASRGAWDAARGRGTGRADDAARPLPRRPAGEDDETDVVPPPDERETAVRPRRPTPPARAAATAATRRAEAPGTSRSAGRGDASAAGVATPVPRGIARGRGDRLRAGAALALVSAALTAVVFLLVLLLVSGWSVRPLKAAVGVSVLPVAALVGSRVPGDAWLRACAGCALVGAGVLALVSLPTVSPAWIVLPQVLAGLGTGMCLPALAGELLPERTARQAGGLISLRHVGITLALLILAPLTAGALDRAIDRARLQGIAIVLDAKLPPQQKLEDVAPVLGRIDTDDARASVQRALATQIPTFAGDADQAAQYGELMRRSDDTIVEAVGRAFRPAFLVTGVLALLAALLAVPSPWRRADGSGVLGDRDGPAVLALAAAIGGLGLLAAGSQVVLARQAGPAPVVLANPCEKRALPDSGGIDGVAQDAALFAIDRVACRYGSSRESLVLALTDDQARRDYERDHGVDPRDERALLGAAVAGGSDGIARTLGDLIGGG